MRSVSLLILLLGLSLSADGQMRFRILREQIDNNPMRTQSLIENSGAPPGVLLEGVPYIDSGDMWEIPLGNSTGGTVFDFVDFFLQRGSSLPPDYLISSVEIRNLVSEGSCGLANSELAVITGLTLDIESEGGVEISVNNSCYLDDEFLNLERMGLSAENTVMRFSFPPILGDVVLFLIEETSPMFGSGADVSVCLQVDFLATEVNTQEPPPPPQPLLQYNINAPSFLDTIGELYDDVTYNGARRFLYTGGTGKLLDGVIGTDPFSEPEEWVGFQDPESAGLRLFFDKEYPVKEIRVYYWNDLSFGMATPTGGVRNRNRNRIMQFSFNTQSVDPNIPNLSVYRGVINNPMEMDYMELLLRTSDQALLISEVSVLQELASGELIDIATDLTQKIFSPGIDSTAFPTDTFSTGIRTLPPLPTSDSQVLTIVYVSMGIIGFLSILIVSMCCLFLVIFLCMRRGAKRQQRTHSPPAPKHASLMRQLSDKYLGTGDKACYNQFSPAGGEVYTEMENIYQQVDRPLPLPPVPGQETSPSRNFSKEDSYIEMQVSQKGPGIGLRIDTGERPPLKGMRTLSEDDYAPVTPPSVPVGVKEPPMRLISDPYVPVTPPHELKPDMKLSRQIIEETYEAVTPPETGGHTMDMLGMTSIPNQYVSLTPADTPRDS